MADFLEKLFALHLRLQGVESGMLSVDMKFKTSTLIDQKLENEADGVRIDNLIKLLEKGAITEQEFKGILKINKSICLRLKRHFIFHD